MKPPGCPTDVPGGAIAKPECNLEDHKRVNGTKHHHCSLSCSKDSECGAPSPTGGKAKCLVFGDDDEKFGYCYYANATAPVLYTVMSPL